MGDCNGWTAYGDHCYQVFSTQYSNAMAMYNCENNGGYLVEVNSQAEQDFLDGKSIRGAV